MFHTRLSTAALFGLLALLLLAAPAGHAADGKKLYKWVDDNGEVHYSDTVPPQAAPKGKDVLNDAGITVHKIDAAKTPAQIAEEERQAKLRAKKRHLAKEQAARDRRLLNTFASEQDIINTRDAKISALENLIRISEGTVKSLNEKLSGLMKTAADHERAGRKVPPYVLQRMHSARNQVRSTEQYIAKKRSEQEAVRKQYERDIKRYRQITADQQQ
jgi:hypothetical protein